VTDERIIDEALAWHHALESEDADWDGYTVWLEADPRHRLAFDQISIVDDAVVCH
jgi:transmembrane sensor